MRTTAPMSACVLGQEPTRTHDLIQLTKPRITVFVGFAAFAGYYLAATGPMDLVRLLHTVLSAMLISAGACVLNQYVERDLDALMDRTKNRALPSGRLSPGAVFLMGVAYSIAGIVYMALAVNALAAAVGAITLGSYIFLYTPLKTRTSLCTIVGAVPGALPPVIGWAASSGELNFGAWLLFGIMFLWQLPHFLAIGWIYRDDYRRAGMPMLPVVDEQGHQVIRQMVMHALALLILSLFPTFAGITGYVYLAGAVITGIGYLALCIRWSLRPQWDRARHVFWASLAHLAFLFVMMILDKA